MFINEVRVLKLIKFINLNMKNKTILVYFMALFAILASLGTVLATDIVNVDKVEVNNIVIGENGSQVLTAVGHVSDTVPIEVIFTANTDVNEDVKVKVYIEGYNSESSDFVVLRTPLKAGITYIQRFSLDLPSSLDLDEEDEEFTLYVRFSARGEDRLEQDYSIFMQRDLRSLNFLSIDTNERVYAGSIFDVDVVLENNGYERLDDVYVRVSIPELGISERAYFGDIESKVDETYDEIRDTVNKRVYLSVPRDAAAGIYDLEVEAYNYDAGILAKKKIVVSGVETGIIPTVTSKAIAVGDETTFDVVLVNPNDRMVVYTITPEPSKGLIIEVDNPVMPVSGDSSETVKVKVKATNSVEEGTYVVSLNVNSEAGLEKKVDFTVNVEDSATKVVGSSDSVFVLTIILVIIFIVLLIVLIVLLTKKPEETEEFGETSYY